MKPAPFRYLAPTTIAEALAHLARYGDEARVLAGGQSLIPKMNFRQIKPAVLIDLNPIPELFYIRPDGEGGLRVGAMTRMRQLELAPPVAERAPLLHEAIPYIAHVQIRNRGTLGGNLAYADPAAEPPALMVALNGRFLLRSQASERWAPANQFFTGAFTTILQPDELLVEIALPALPPRTGWAFTEVARRHGDRVLVGAAAQVTLADTPAGLKCRQARLVFLNAGDGPVEAYQAAAILAGQAPTPQVIRTAAKTAARLDVDPPGDHHASAAYRRHLVEALAGRVLPQAFAMAAKRK